MATPDIYFLVCHFLSRVSPCSRAAQVLQEELFEHNLLGDTVDWQGRTRAATYHDVRQNHPHLRNDQLQQLLSAYTEDRTNTISDPSDPSEIEPPVSLLDPVTSLRSTTTDSPEIGVDVLQPNAHFIGIKRCESSNKQNSSKNQEVAVFQPKVSRRSPSLLINALCDLRKAQKDIDEHKYRLSNVNPLIKVSYDSSSASELIDLPDQNVSLSNTVMIGEHETIIELDVERIGDGSHWFAAQGKIKIIPLTISTPLQSNGELKDNSTTSLSTTEEAMNETAVRKTASFIHAKNAASGRIAFINGAVVSVSGPRLPETNMKVFKFTGAGRHSGILQLSVSSMNREMLITRYRQSSKHDNERLEQLKERLHTLQKQVIEEQSKTFALHRDPVECIALSHVDVLLKRELSGYLPSYARPLSCVYNRFRKLKTYSGHYNMSCHCVGFDQIGQTIITGGDDSLVKLWSAKTGHLLFTLRSHVIGDGVITDCKVNHNNQLLATASGDKTIRIWNLHDSRPLAVLNGHTEMVNLVGWDAKTSVLASCSDDGTCIVWDLRKIDHSSQEVCVDVPFTVFPHMQRNGNASKVHWISCNTSGDYFATGCDDGVVRIFSMGTRRSSSNTSADTREYERNTTVKLRLEVPKDHVSGNPLKVQFQNPFTKALISKTINIPIHHKRGDVVDVSIQCSTSTLDSDDSFGSRQTMNDGTHNSTDSTKFKRLLPKPIGRIVGHMNTVQSVKFSRQGDRVLSVCRMEGAARITHWSAANGQGRQILLKSSSSLSSPVGATDVEMNVSKQKNSSGRTSRGGRRTTTTAPNSQYRMVNAVWDCEDRFVVTSQFTQPPKSMEKNPKTNWKSRLKVWDSRTVGKRECYVVVPHPTDSRIILTGDCAGSVCLWNIHTGKRLFHSTNIHVGGPSFEFQPAGTPVPVVEASFGPDGLSFVISDQNGRWSMYSTGARSQHDTAPPEQYLIGDNGEMDYDNHNVALDRQTQLPPHLNNRGMLVNSHGEAYEIQPPPPEQLLDLRRAFEEILENSEANRVDDGIENNINGGNGTGETLNSHISSSSSSYQSLSRYNRNSQRVNENDVDNSADKRRRFVQSLRRQALACERVFAKEREDARLQAVNQREPDSDGYITASSATSVELSDGEAWGGETEEERDRQEEEERENRRRRQQRRQQDSMDRASRAARRARYNDNEDDEYDAPVRRGRSRAARQIGSYADLERSDVDDEESESNSVYDSDSADDGEIISGGAASNTRARTQRRGRGQLLGGRTRTDTHSRRQRRTLQQIRDERRETERKNREDRKRAKEIRRVEEKQRKALEPSEWVSQSNALSFPCQMYIPQVGDIVIYFPKGHRDQISKYQDNTLPPWIKHNFNHSMIECEVVDVNFTFEDLDIRSVFPDSIVRCEVKLKYIGTPSWPRRNSRNVLQPIEFKRNRSTRSNAVFTVFLRKGCDLPDYLVCKEHFNLGMNQIWKVGDNATQAYNVDDGSLEYYPVTVSGISLDRSDEFPISYFECISIIDAEVSAPQPDASPWELFLENDSRKNKQIEEAEEIRIKKPGWLSQLSMMISGVSEWSAISVYFADAVNVKDAANYYEIVPSPISLKMMKQRLENCYYRHVKSIVHDAELFLKNCRKYNRDDSDPVRIATQLRDSLLYMIENGGVIINESKEDKTMESVSNISECALSGVSSSTPNVNPNPKGSSVSLSKDDCDAKTTMIESPTVIETSVPIIDLSARFNEILSNLEASDTRVIFAQPVSDEIASDYSSVVSNPMDFGTIRKKIGNKEYKTLQEFASDIWLTFRNCIHYNGDSGCFSTEATRLLHEANDLFLPLAKELNIDISDDISAQVAFVQGEELIEDVPKSKGKGKKRSSNTRKRRREEGDSSFNDSYSDESSSDNSSESDYNTSRKLRNRRRNTRNARKKSKISNRGKRRTNIESEDEWIP